MSTIVDDLKQEVASLRDELQRMRQMDASSYYYSKAALEAPAAAAGIPPDGMPPKTARTVIENSHAIDFNQKLNTASYVNVEFEEDEEAVALMGLRINLADQTVYPRSYELHDAVVNMIARLWHCPKPEDFARYHVFPGAGTVGSTEACLLAGLALKFRWRRWYAERSASSVHAVRGELPNLVISSCFQAAWEKLFKYMDVEPRLVFPRRDTFTVDPEQVRAAIDERTIGVVCIMGNHYAGGAALFRRRSREVHGLLRAAWQELLDASKAWWRGRRGRLADGRRCPVSVSLGVVPLVFARFVEVPVRIEVAAGP